MAGVNIKVGEETFGGASKAWLRTRKGLQDMKPIMLDLSAFTANHLKNGYIPSGTCLGKITASGKYGPYSRRTDEIQTVTISATGGTFTLSFEGAATAAIAYNATAAAVKDALELLPGINEDDITVSLDSSVYTITFIGQYAGQNVPALVSNAASLTGGAGTAVVATATAGAAGSSDGRQKLAGHLFEDVKVDTGDVSTATDVATTLYWTGVVNTSKLPVFSGTNEGEIDDNGKADVAAWIQYW